MHRTCRILALSLCLTISAAWAAGPWREGRAYQLGERVMYHGQLYEVQQAHDAVKGANWNPEAAPALWRKVEAHGDGQWGDRGSWREGVSYARGQLISYRGRTYRCLQSHKAERGAGWTPEKAPSLWEAVERPYPQPR
ncbi:MULTISPECIES: carbohydrate-binding protein [Chitinibacter]|uniref:carbohydrate-binding protein n=1 Tax=Chitinibacter TaxID=230666 RepID=UPI00042287F6|nr:MULTISPECIES: carbohydrate-binding protein [Chitinibacter]